MDQKNFVQLCTTLAAIDMFGSRPPAPSWPDGADVATVRTALDDARTAIPLGYAGAYIDPLSAQLARVIPDPTMLETLAGAVAQHGPGYPLAANLDRFLAVVSNLYRSFLDREKRAAADFPPLEEALPPLATFKYQGDDGPFTVPVDSVAQFIGGSAGVVSLPATYADHPVLWASLAHETGGHDVVHADAGLLQELQNGLPRALKGTAVPGLRSSDLVALWSYWMDEAVADVYGLLNIGPTFAFNLAAFFSALRSKTQAGGFPIPKISMQSVSRADSPLDVHPTDILRIHLAIGVVQALGGLASAKRTAYVADLHQLAGLCATGDTVEISGYAVLDGGDAVQFDASVALPRLQETARKVGGYIATANLAALGKHSIQDIETWDDADEARAEAIRAALAARQPIGALGDDAQLLAGATARLLEAPGDYASITQALNDGLDQSYASDPIWSLPAAEPIFRIQTSPSLAAASAAPRRAGRSKAA